MIDLKGKSVLITGGSRGIGAACVRLFLKADADVAFTYSANKHSAEKLLQELKGSSKIIIKKADASSETEVQKAVEEIIDELGKIDILVNNAGVWKQGAVDTMALSEWEETIKINLTGTFLFSKAVIPFMKKNNYGRIINITSTAGQRGEAFYSHYASSKGGVISFTKSLAAELGKFNITVNSVAPGWVITDMTKNVFADKNYFEQEKKNIPLQRIAEPEDIAGPVLFLASAMANHITGEILNVNGGSVLCG